MPQNLRHPDDRPTPDDRWPGPQPPAHLTPDDGWLRWARSVLAESSPELTHALADVRVLREGPKRLVVAHLADRTGLVLKQYADDRGAWTRRWLQRLAAAGFVPPARFAVTPARGWSSTHRTLVTDLAAGPSWSRALHAPAADRSAAATAAADWLIRLQSLSVALPERSTHRAGPELCRQSSRLADGYPDHASRLRWVARTAHRRLYDHLNVVGTELVVSHGDLHPENLHVATGAAPTVTAIDVDTAGLRRPSYDVGYAIAQLLIVSWMRTGSFQAGAASALVFWDRWTAPGPSDVDAVPAQMARALVQSLDFELITYGTRRVELLGHWLDIAEAALTDGVVAACGPLAQGREARS